MKKNLVVVVSWDLFEVGSGTPKMDPATSEQVTEKFMELDSLIVRDLSKALGGARVDGPHSGRTGDTYAFFVVENWELASQFVLEHWGDADGGDLLIHGALSEEAAALAYELERSLGVYSYDEPHLMFRINMDEVQIDSWSRESGRQELYSVEPTTGDEYEFVDALQEHFGL